MAEWGPHNADGQTWRPELRTCWEGNAHMYVAIRGQEKVMQTRGPLWLPPCSLSDLPRAAVFRCFGKSGQRMRPGWTGEGIMKDCT